MEALARNQLALAPLGAGDLIDRALRLYRRHFFVLIRTAAPPIIIVAAGWMLMSISFREIFIVSDRSELFLNILLLMASVGIMTTGYLLIVVVMGGATRTLVAHLLRNDPVTARATYAAVKARFWGLMLASIIILIFVSFMMYAAIFVIEIVVVICVLAGTGLANFVPSWLILVSFVRQKFTVRLNRANRGFSTVVGRSQLAPLEATS